MDYQVDTEVQCLPGHVCARAKVSNGKGLTVTSSWWSVDDGSAEEEGFSMMREAEGREDEKLQQLEDLTKKIRELESSE